MLINAQNKTGIVTLTLLVLLVVVSVGRAQDAGPLEQVEQDGYLQWLHSLEQEVAAREASGVPENHRLFPFNHEASAVTDSTPYRHLTIAKALGVLETQFPNPRNAKGLSALVALANARNYVNLTEFDSSLVWYAAAAQLDTTGDFTPELKLESLAAAIVAGDSLRLSDRVQKMAASGLADVDPLATVLALRWCLADGDSAQVSSLATVMLARRDSLQDAQRYWLARALNQLERPAALYAELKVLVRNGGLSLGLTEDQRSWVLTTLADVSYLLGLEDQARSLYSTLTESPLEPLNLWATYQLAGIDLTDGEYLAASTGYGAVCRAKALGSWHDQACAMEKIAVDLERIRRDGEPYGASRFYNP